MFITKKVLGLLIMILVFPILLLMNLITGFINAISDLIYSISISVFEIHDHLKSKKEKNEIEDNH